jgi:hypothetical protein
MSKIIQGIAVVALVLSLNGCYSRANIFFAGQYSIRLEWLGFVVLVVVSSVWCVLCLQPQPKPETDYPLEL